MEIREKVTYRKKESKYIYTLVEQLNSLLLYSTGGVGISRLLRFISYCKDHPFKPKNIEFIYEDWCLHFENQAEFKKIILKTVANCKSKVCFVIDEFDTVNGNEIVLFLRGLRSKNKDKVCYIFALKDGSSVDKIGENLSALVGKNILEIGPLTFSDFKFAVLDIAKTLNVKLSLKEIKHLYNKTGGLVREAREAIQLLSQQKNYGDLAYRDNNGLVLKLGEILFLNKTITFNFTKSEEAVLKQLLKEKNTLVKKDDLAKVLSPTTEGDGVSDESIDQIIHRLRKKLATLETSTNIETITGRGYKIT